ncbi:hypothetical protein CWC22_012575 [Pseudoalteromonas rubra]|uniref:Lipoprotein n=2 Tax=Pseudoalteromonas TaxID=53246 RepID=A0A5S3V032_9GAMM|nr:hypothetical protein [Pseudoalteromonas rubra]QPB83784.1 hypothetical protein CWC22_012575 [Pseudoalteromonas rubra]
MKWFVLSLFLFSSGLFACSPNATTLSNERREERKLEEAFALQIAQEADFIGIGRAVKVRSVDEEALGYQQRVFFTVYSVLKGTTSAEVSALMLKTDTLSDAERIDDIYVCGKAQKPSVDDAYAVETYKYLFYIKDGILLRTNTYPEAPLPMSPAEEVAFLRLKQQIDSH